MLPLSHQLHPNGWCRSAQIQNRCGKHAGTVYISVRFLLYVERSVQRNSNKISEGRKTENQKKKKNPNPKLKKILSMCSWRIQRRSYKHNRA